MSEITAEVVAEHGLSPDEYQRVLEIMGRAPNLVELGIFSVMWSEHCSYKSSKKWLKTLPVDAPHVIQGPGENAGVIDLGEGLAAIFKMESHNHPSFIEPYQGAATGVGGILRDVFTMGARPVMNLNALRFGSPDHPKTRHLVSGVVAGVGGYGNCVGVPTVGGEVDFHPAYNGNNLVNAMTVGLAPTNRIFYSAAAGGLGLVLDLDRVPMREEGMTPYELMLSESQERMLLILKPGHEEEARAIIEKWDLDFAIIGRLTDTGRMVLRWHGDTVGDLPIDPLAEAAPEYDRPWVPTPTPAELSAQAVPDSAAPLADLERLLATPNLCSRRWVWEQYDHMVMGDTVRRPGGDAAVTRIHRSNRGLAATTDCAPRYCVAEPVRGGKQAVAESWRNLTAVGATPLAITNNMNFGNPEKPEIMGQFVGAIEGMREACLALDYPVVSGNVSLYNETEGKAILPTPVIGGVGLIADLDKLPSGGFTAAGQAIILVGATAGHLGQSLYLRELHGREEGRAPDVDLADEKRNGDFVRQAIDDQRVVACHDLSDGGLLVALAEMALAGRLGAKINPPETLPNHAWFFGEDQARYLVTCDDPAAFLAAAAAAGVPASVVGETGGQTLTIGEGQAIALDRLRQAYEGWLPHYMAGE